MATDLTRIGEKARKEPGLVFTSLYHHICDVDNLRACYDTLEANKATGVDGVTKEEYGKNLEENLRDLSERLKRMGYRPEPKRRSYIPKAGSEKGRPLGISSLEDKIVEEATKRTLEPIYEAVFEGSSYAYRPGSSPHKCLDALGRTIQQKKVSYVVEVGCQKILRQSESRVDDQISAASDWRRACDQADHSDAQEWHSWRMAWYRRARKGLHRVPSCLHCCPTSTCIMCWTCGSAGG